MELFDLPWHLYQYLELLHSPSDQFQVVVALQVLVELVVAHGGAEKVETASPAVEKAAVAQAVTRSLTTQEVVAR